MNPFDQLIPDDVEQRMIDRMKELRAKGESLRAIAAFLNENEIPTKNGGTWQANTILKIILANI